MDTKERWERVAADLVAAGFDAKLTANTYWGGTYYRPVQKVGYKIVLKAPDGGLVVIDDHYWKKNPDIWVGYQAHLEDRDSIVRRDMRWTKKRAEVVAFVKSVTG